MTTEADFQRAVCDLARRLGWTVFHVSDSRRIVRKRGRLVAIGDAEVAGLPDLLLIRERVMWRELKSETGRMRPKQTATIARLKQAGADVEVWRPRDWPLIQEQLTRQGGAAPLAGGNPGAAVQAATAAAPPDTTLLRRSA